MVESKKDKEDWNKRVPYEESEAAYEKGKLKEGHVKKEEKGLNKQVPYKESKATYKQGAQKEVHVKKEEKGFFDKVVDEFKKIF